MSLFSQIDKSEFIYIPIKFSSPIISFALFLIVFVGLTKQLIVIIPQLIKSFENSSNIFLTYLFLKNLVITNS